VTGRVDLDLFQILEPDSLKVGCILLYDEMFFGLGPGCPQHFSELFDESFPILEVNYINKFANVRVITPFSGLATVHDFFYLHLNVIFCVGFIECMQVIFFDQFQLINDGDDFCKDIGTDFSEILDILRSYLSTIEIGALVLLGSFSFDKLKQHQSVIFISKAGQFAGIVQFLA